MTRKIIFKSISILLIISVYIFITKLTTAINSIILFVLTLTISGALILSERECLIKFNVRASNLILSLHIVFILSTILLAIFEFTGTQVIGVSSLLFLIVFSISPGFSLFNILGFERSVTRFELITLAYPFSLGILSLFGTLVLSLEANLRDILCLLMVLSLLVISCLASIRRVLVKSKLHLIKINGNTILMISIASFFLFIYAILYPRLAESPSLDIARNYLEALAFTKNKMGDFFSTTTYYPLFNIFQSLEIRAIGISVDLFHLTSIATNFLVFLAYYAMAKCYLRSYSKNTPAIATLIWSIFGGFGWWGLLKERIYSATPLTMEQILRADLYGDLTWKRLFFSFAMETSFVLVFSIVYLLHREDLFWKREVILATILISPLPFIHPYGSYLLFFMLIAFSLFGSKRIMASLCYIAYSMLISSIIQLMINYFLISNYSALYIDLFKFIQYFMVGLTILGIVRLKNRLISYSIRLQLSQYASRLPFWIAIVFLFSTIIVTAAWAIGYITFEFDTLITYWYVPWAIYVVKFGMTLILTILTILFIIKKKIPATSAIVMIDCVLIIILFTRVMSTIQLQNAEHFVYRSNWVFESLRTNIEVFREERMLNVLSVPMSLVASIGLSYILMCLKRTKDSTWELLTTFSFILLLVFSGIGSTIVGFEFFNQAAQNPDVNLTTLQSLNTLRQIVYADGKSIITSPATPAWTTDFTGAVTIATESGPIWSSQSPEFPMQVLRYSFNTPTYIYLNKALDIAKLSDYEGNYLAHLAYSLPEFIENSEVKVERISNWSTPVPVSSTALLIPFDITKMSVLQPQYEYASPNSIKFALYFENDSIHQDVYSHPIAFNNITKVDGAFLDGFSSYIRANGTAIAFRELSVQFEFIPLNVTANQIIVSKLDWGAFSEKSWEVAQYGQKLVFKLSPDGVNEIVLTTNSFLKTGIPYKVECEYDGFQMRTIINGTLKATKSYTDGIHQTNTDIIIGAELHNGYNYISGHFVLKYIRILNQVPSAPTTIFHAYDILSSAGLNYTTVLSDDNTMANYVTLVIPYDDSKTEILIEHLINDTSIATKNIIILNINGYGPLMNLFGTMTPFDFNATSVIIDTPYNLDDSVNLPLIIPTLNTSVLAMFYGDKYESPFVFTRILGNLKLIYLNVYPFITQGHSITPMETLVTQLALQDYTQKSNPKVVSGWFSNPSLLFSNLIVNGSSIMSSESMAGIRIIGNATLNLDIAENKSAFKNIKSIKIEGSYALKLNSTYSIFGNGYGFYTKIITFDPKLRLEGKSSIYINIDGKELHASEITLDVNGCLTLLVRRLILSAAGTLEFQSPYSIHPAVFPSQGQNVTMTGNAILYFDTSDKYTVALPYTLYPQLSVDLDDRLSFTSQVDSLYLTVVLVLIIAAVFVSLILINFYWSSVENIPKSVTVMCACKIPMVHTWRKNPVRRNARAKPPRSPELSGSSSTTSRGQAEYQVLDEPEPPRRQIDGFNAHPAQLFS